MPRTKRLAHTKFAPTLGSACFNELADAELGGVIGGLHKPSINPEPKYPGINPEPKYPGINPEPKFPGWFPWW